MQEAQYTPYKSKNTIEGYKEFIGRYPTNTFVGEAKVQIDNLEFAPYEQADSVEGYMEFKLLFPENRHRSKAALKIEQSELKRYEKIDSIAGYKEYLSKYPESNFAILAKERLQELEFREFDKLLNDQYGFDLLAYRLQLRRLKKSLAPEAGFDMGAFACFASFSSNGGNRHFHTQLIYPSDISYLDGSSDPMRSNFFDRIFSPALIYLNRNFARLNAIDGFSFDISWAAGSYHGDRKVLLECFFHRDDVARFAQNMLDGAGLMAKAMIIAPERTAADATASTHRMKPAAEMPRQPIEDLEKLDGMRIMALVYEQDRGDDSIISSSWQRGRHSMKVIEKRKNFTTSDEFVYKQVARYIDPPSHYGELILVWNYKSREKAFWHKSFTSDPARVTDAERYRPPAESDFNTDDYVDIAIAIANEKHERLKNEEWGGRPCFVVESTPADNRIKYGKRMSWIDQSCFIPLKIAYWDREGRLWKVLTMDWQNNFGFWFWKQATVENTQTAEKTFITIDDVRVNQGFSDADFTMHGLERQKHGL
jgi:outer membrane lipoprotein-sorting protein